MQQLTGAGCWDASQGATQTFPPSRAPHVRLTICERRKRSSRRHSRETTQRTPRADPPTPPAQHAAVPTSVQCMQCAAVSTCECPAPVGAAGPRIPGARTPLRFVVRLAQPHAAPAHPSATQQAPAAHCTPAAIAEKRVACPASRSANAPPTFRTSLRTAKNRRNRRPRRSTARARSWCPLLHKHSCRNVKKGVTHGVHAGQRDRAARTAYPEQMAARGPPHVDLILGGLVVVLVSLPAPRPSSMAPSADGFGNGEKGVRHPIYL